MSYIWLIEAVAESVVVSERHLLNFEIGNNKKIEHKEAEIHAVVSIPVDGNKHLKEKSLARAAAAYRAGDQARLGIFGLAAQDNQSSTINDILKKPIEPAPLFDANQDGSIVTWALDLPGQVETKLADRQITALEQVCVYETCLPLETYGLYPLNMEAYLAVFGDDLPNKLENLINVKRGATLAAAKTVADAITRQASARSQFYLDIEMSVPTEMQGHWVKLTRFALDWPAGGDGSDIVLGSSESDETICGRYNPLSAQVEFMLPEALAKTVLKGKQPGVTLQIKNSTILLGMEPLKGRVEIEVEGLTSGLRPFLSDVSGSVVSGLGTRGPALVARTLLKADFRIYLEEKFLHRRAVQQIRLQFPGRRLRKDHLRQLETLFKNLAFNVEQFNFEVEPDLQYLLYGHRLVSGAKQYLVFLITPEKREVFLQVTAQGGQTTENRKEELNDVVVDMAAVGPDYDKISGLLKNLQDGVASILGGK